MDAEEIKNTILDDVSVIEKILEDLGMHHIQLHTTYYTFGLPNGDNHSSTTLYLDSLGVKAYTREEEHIKDIIDLVVYVQKISNTVNNSNCATAIKWLCKELGLQYSKYTNNYHSNIYSSPFQKFKDSLTEIEKAFKNEEIQQHNILLPLLDENYLKAYIPWNNTEFYKDNISYETQTEFELGIDVFSHRATIPIRDELGRLVGIKGRRIFDVVDEYNPKYVYLKKCEKGKILYGLYKTLPYIKEKNEIIICESEKGVMQLWSYGIKNSVAVGGHSISPTQIEKIIRINVDNVIIAFDKDVSEKELLKEYKKLYNIVDVTCIVDIYNTLKEKESPMDIKDNWDWLYKKRRYKFDVEKGVIIK